MIPAREIKEMARESGVPVSTIERDYAQNWLLAALGSLPMALKGGTGIRKVYIEQYRFSDDLDFTFLEPFERIEIATAVSHAVHWVYEECGIRFEDDVGLINTKTGYRATTRFRILSGSALSPIKIDFDLTRMDYEEVLLPVQRRDIFHPYSDNPKATVPSYCLEEIMAEKIRSIFQRVRPRDIYDIWQLDERVRSEDVMAILQRKCKAKGIVLDADILHNKEEKFRSAWNNSLRHQMKHVPEFSVAFETTLLKLEEYSHEDTSEHQSS